MEGQLAPDFELPSTGGRPLRLSDLRGRPVVLYFYPKDNTPGCTVEGQDFRDLYPGFQALDCEIFGISRDGLKSHEGFKAKLGLPFELLSDEDERTCEAYGVIKMKNMYGKKVRGIERSTFIVDRAGKVVREWRGVKVPNHVQDVLETIHALS
jgi:thioredoxin-dependent peroxiredoxin